MSQIGEQGGNIARIASLLAGIPNEASACTINHLKRTGGRAGVQMMCGGGGIGIATVIEAV